MCVQTNLFIIIIMIKVPFTISPDDDMWRHLFAIFERNLDQPIRFYNKALTAALNLTFKVCSKPYRLCEEFAVRVVGKVAEILAKREAQELERFLIVRLVHMFGEMAVKLLNFLDENVYKELKRRHFVREEMREDRKGEGKKKTRRVAESASKSASSSVLNESSRNVTTVSAGLVVLLFLGEEGGGKAILWVFRVEEEMRFSCTFARALENGVCREQVDGL